MRRNANPEGLDLDTRSAAEAAARRAGLSLEEWVAALTASERREASPPARKRIGEIDAIIARMGRAPSDHDIDAQHERAEAEERAARTAVALESMAVWIEQAEERLNEAARNSADHQDRLATVLSQALTTLKDRLDAVERQVVAERMPAPPTRIEFPINEAVAALAPLSDTLTGLRMDMGRLAERLEHPLDIAPSPTIEAIRTDLERLQGSVGSLASRDEIAKLDHSIRHLAGNLASGNSHDMLTLARSVADLERQLQHMMESLSDTVHRRISSELDTLSQRIDKAAETGVDRSVIEFLSSQIIDMRQDLSQRAEPQQLEKLSGDVTALAQQVTELRLNQVGRHDFAALKTSLEDICTALDKTLVLQASNDVPARLDSLSERVDLLVNRPEPEPLNLTPVARQLALLTERMGEINDNRARHSDALMTLIERLSADVQAVAERPEPSHEPLLERFGQLENELRQVGRQIESQIESRTGGPLDTSVIEDMLRTIGEKLDRAPAPALDAIEQRLVVLAEQLAESRDATPPVNAGASLKDLQEEASLIAERAAERVLRGAPPAVTESDIDALKQGFVELKALHTRADKKTQQTLRAVYDALETLVGRGIPQTNSVAVSHHAGITEGMPSADRLEAAVRRLHAATLSQIEDVTATRLPQASVSTTETEETQPDTESNEMQDLTSATFPAEADLGNVRSSFIAAARRASQQEATKASETPSDITAPIVEISLVDLDGDFNDKTGEESLGPAIAGPSLIQRLRRTLDNHKRPLLLGLAFLVLATGSFQIVSSVLDPDPQTLAALEGKPAKSARVAHEPATVGSINPAPVATVADEGEVAQSAALDTTATPKGFFIDPSSLGEIPAGTPVVLKEAVLGGDATAVYELATRLAEGRGVDQDSTLAARLFERAAQAGLAPAQERLAMAYEKGFGLTRDVKAAAAWYERAALGGNTRAMHNFATLLAAGISGKPDYAAALPWYVEAAEAGLRDSQFNLGVMYARGATGRQDLVQAYKWFALAANQGDADAAKKRDEVAAKMSAGDAVAAKALVERWRPRATDSQANELNPPVKGRTAALDQKPEGRT
ncbi:tetratricopeptide repeat protein [Microvirga flavescens]|uniref:tetratricopeptide repeat protein n=1 Tax=Microvirga flavescens TaxID=2249811 RepID=UPI000DD83334|nr:tetratricopeptide repeat protein [Microvirga flavescens]